MLLQEYWWLYLCDKKKADLITVPVRVTNLVDKQEIDVKFPAPKKTGVYTYTMCLKSDSYIDMDLTQNLKVLSYSLLLDLSLFYSRGEPDLKLKGALPNVVDDVNLWTRMS